MPQVPPVERPWRTHRPGGVLGGAKEELRWGTFPTYPTAHERPPGKWARRKRAPRAAALLIADHRREDHPAPAIARRDPHALARTWFQTRRAPAASPRRLRGSGGRRRCFPSDHP